MRDIGSATTQLGMENASPATKINSGRSGQVWPLAQWPLMRLPTHADHAACYRLRIRYLASRRAIRGDTVQLLAGAAVVPDDSGR
jgi:hypothetical protein